MHNFKRTNQQTHSSWTVTLRIVACVAVCACTLAEAALSPRVVITPVGDFTISWDGNNGGFYSPAAGAGPADNLALASHGTVAIGSTEFGAGGVHMIANVNDGLYGNSHSWIANFSIPDPNPFIGLRFSGPTSISSIAWSRDNGNTTEGGCAGGTCVDRCVGVYTLQYTTVDAPDASTPETFEPATGWANIGTVEYLGGIDDIYFSAYLRHRFDLAQSGAPLMATGIRIRCRMSAWTLMKLK